MEMGKICLLTESHTRFLKLSNHMLFIIQTSKIKESWRLKLKQQKKIKQKRTFSYFKIYVISSLLRSKENEKKAIDFTKKAHNY